MVMAEPCDMRRESFHNSYNTQKHCSYHMVSTEPRAECFVASDTSKISNSTSKEAMKILQMDGNDSFCSTLDTTIVETEEEGNIPVIVGFRPPKPPTVFEPTCFLAGPYNMVIKNNRKTIRRDNRGELAFHLPIVAVYNHRSIWSKLNNFITEFK